MVGPDRCPPRGRRDGWLDAKRSGNRERAHAPDPGMLTAGTCRSTMPGGRLLICDQNFCSSLTAHHPTGCISGRAPFALPSTDSKANVTNGDVDYRSRHRGPRFPERLEGGISWRIYQGNKKSRWTRGSGAGRRLLANLPPAIPSGGFTQYHVQFATSHRPAPRERCGRRCQIEIEAWEALTPSPSRNSKLATAR